jgi:membrane-associated HD superfamily phosphohydrolase
MAKGKNSQNFLAKRKRPVAKGARGPNASNEALDVVLMNKVNSINKSIEDISLKFYNSYNKIFTYIGLGLFVAVYVLINYIEKKITNYTYQYEHIAEIKYKSVYNGHYNYKGKESYETLTAMGEGGRKVYLYYNLVLIFIYSPFLFFSITNLITEICGFTKTNICPFFIALFQIIESAILVFTIKGYPNSLLLLNLAAKVAIVKYFFIFITIFVVIFGCIDRYQKKPKPTGPEVTPENIEKMKKSE